MTDIPREQGGDGSPQLDLDEIDGRLAVGVWPTLPDCEALVALVRRLQQENEGLFKYADAASSENVTLRGRVEQLTALIERMLKIHGDDYDALVAADWETALGLHELAEEAWVADARAALARVVPEKETP